MGRTRRSQIAEPNLPATFDPADPGELDDVALHGSTLAGAHGLGDLRNIVIGPDQVLDVAVPVLATLGIRVDDDPAPDTATAD